MPRMGIRSLAAFGAAVAVCMLAASGRAHSDGAVEKLVGAALESSVGYNRLRHMCAAYGQRICGSEGLEKATEWCAAQMEEDGLQRVRREAAPVPNWVRGKESANLLQPYARNLPVMGLGNSVGTGGKELLGEVLVADSFDDLKAKAAQAVGKIVLFDVPFTTYGETVQYRSKGAIEAAKSPHTGGMGYDDTVPKIPAASLTVEDSELLHTLSDMGETVIVSLSMAAETLPDVISYNVMGEVTGSEHPEETVVIGGHIDSWDVGHGASDDGGGCLIAMEAVRLMKVLGLKPKRTVRAVLWVNEENGATGGKVYAAGGSGNRTESTVLAIESDGGITAPEGFGFSGSKEALAIMNQLATQLSAAFNRTLEVQIEEGGGGVDIRALEEGGVPVAGVNTDRSRYFWYHHSDADTINIIDKNEMAQCTAMLAGMAYLVADADQPLPR